MDRLSGLPALDAAFPPGFAGFGCSLAVGCGDALPLDQVLSPPGLRRVACRFAAGFGDADPRAALSLWSQYYLLNLVPCATALALVAGHDAPVAIAGMGVMLDLSGRPTGLSLPHAGCPVVASCPAGRLTPLLRTHLEPLAEALAGAGLPPRVFWSNAAATLVWTLGVLAGPAGAIAATRTALAAPCWEDRRANPFLPALDAGGQGRRVCCLRYRLPGVATCHDCPRGRSISRPVARPAGGR